MRITKRQLKKLIKEISDEDHIPRHNPVDRSNVPQKYSRSEHELPWDHPDKRHGAKRLPLNIKRQAILDELSEIIGVLDDEELRGRLSPLMVQLWALEEY